jgi:hypothetical protein
VRFGVHGMNKYHYNENIFSEYVDLEEENLPIERYLAETVESNDLEETTNELTGCIRLLTSLSRVDGLLW